MPCMRPCVHSEVGAAQRGCKVVFGDSGVAGNGSVERGLPAMAGCLGLAVEVLRELDWQTEDGGREITSH